MLSGSKILVTGATGQVARPIAEALAQRNEVWCIARFSDPEARRQLEARGIRTHAWHLGDASFGALPDDFTHVVHSAAEIYTPSYDESIRANAEGAGFLMAHCRKARAFLHVSTFGVYEIHPDREHAYREDDRLGGYASYAPTYAVGKLAAEAVVRTAARQLGLPTTIARLNIAYGSAGHGGVPTQMCDALAAGRAWPLMARPNWGSPIHEDDLIWQTEALLEAASVPATIVNWAGDEAVSERQMLEHITDLTGLPLRTESSEVTFNFFVSDNTRRRQLVGPCRIHWKDGFRRALAARFPDLRPPTAG
jgi:nucleoside-diphosphate-sugar epimerase